MKVIAHGPYSGNWPNGTIFSPIPDQLVEVPDDDADRVAYLRSLADSGLATILEDAPQSAPELGIVELRAKAEALGVAVDGRWSAKRLQAEIDKAEQEA